MAIPKPTQGIQVKKPELLPPAHWDKMGLVILK